MISPYFDITAYGVRILSAVMKRAGIETRLIFLSDRNQSMYKDDVFQQVLELCADTNIIGISLFSCHFPKIADLTRRIKEKLSVPVIWGGKHPSAKPEEALKYADIVCIGEGEKAIVELIKKMEKNEPFYDVKNFWFKTKGEIIKNDLGPITENLDTLPFPDYSLEEHYIWDNEIGKIIKMDAFALQRFLIKEPETTQTVYNTLASWGCPYACTYCFTFRDIYKGEKYMRFRSVQNIINELENIKTTFPFIGKVLLSDDNFFTLGADTIRNFALAYKERIALPIKCLVHPQNVTEEKLSYMIEAGLDSLQMGVETGSKKTKKLYQRNVSNNTIIEAVCKINKFKDKIVPSYDFILDNPYEAKEDVLDTIKLLLKFPKPYHINTFSLTFFPGTALYNKAVKDGVIPDETKDWEFHKKNYLNLVLQLLKYPIPRFVIKLLINKSIVNIFENKYIIPLLYGMFEFIKSFKKIFFKGN